MIACRWSDVASALSGQPAGSRVSLPKYHVEHPRAARMRTSIGLPVGQTADFRLVLDGGRGLHVQDFGDRYEAHIDSTDPSCDVVRHLVEDAPGTAVVAGALVGGAFGLLAGGKQAGLAGLLLGAALAGLMVAANSPAPEKTPAKPAKSFA